MTIDLAELKTTAEKMKPWHMEDAIPTPPQTILALIEAVEAAKELQRLRHGDPPHTKKQMEILGEADSTLQDALAPFTEDRA